MVNRIILGNLGSTYGLKISKPGYEVTTTNSENLLMDTNNNYFKSVITGTLSLSAGGTSTTSITLGTTYSSLMLIGHLTTVPTTFSDIMAPGGRNQSYELKLDSSGILTFTRFATASMPANSITYTVFGS